MVKQNKSLILCAGVLLAILMFSFGLLQKPLANSNEAENDHLTNFKSTIPMVTAPLYILAKGMHLIEK